MTPAENPTKHPILDRAATLLPHQGPLSVFIHQNTLSALEDLSFPAALDHASRITGATVRLPESDYRAMLSDGRVTLADLDAAFRADEGTREPTAYTDDGLPTSADLRWLLLRAGIEEESWRTRAFRQSEGLGEPALTRMSTASRHRLAVGANHQLGDASEAQVAHLLAGTGDLSLAAERIREQLGIGSLLDATRQVTEPEVATRLGFALLRQQARERLPERRAATPAPDIDLDEVHERVDDLLLPIVAAALDLGAASWHPPAGGLWQTGLAVLLAAGASGNRTWHRALRKDLRQRATVDAATALDGLLLDLDRSGARHEALLTAVLLARPGWAGAVRVRELHHGAPSLLDYALLRLLLTVSCLRAEGVDPVGALLARSRKGLHPATMADRVAQLLAQAGIGPDEALHLSGAAWDRARRVLLDGHSGWRCRLLHEARERASERAWLAALAARATLGRQEPAGPEVQAIFCIDEREESLRRALEEVAGPGVATFGTAGFFGLAIRFRGAEDAHGSNRCPVVIQPTHRVEERAPRSWARAVFSSAGHLLERASRTALLGVAAASVGPVALLSSAARVFAPARTLRWGAAIARVLAPEPTATLHALREQDDDGAGLPLGFTANEAAEHIASTLAGIGLDHFAPVVLVVGHGSTSLNNPHESAHDCGACGGAHGGRNARTFAALANAPAVRRRLADLGWAVPDETVFVGGSHDTASDGIAMWCDDRAPIGLAGLQRDLDAARAADARERARRFPGSPPGHALAHVEARSKDLSQVRPEYGHATNAFLIVGPRALTRGLFLDRRAFLQSYEPDRDTDGTVLAGLLAAVVPVCAGINLEYYFSRVDNERFGAGTKIPHNVVGLHGVVNGSLGDLRTGLPWQMVEIHEPVRLLTVVLADVARVKAALDGLPGVMRLVRGAWIKLVVLDGARAWRWRDGDFVDEPVASTELPVVQRSHDWFGGRDRPLGPARVLGAEVPR